MFFLELMKKGGPVMWIILICSLLALFIFLIKVFQFHRDEIGVRELLRGLFNVLKRDGIVEALTLCDNTPGPVARILCAGILAHQRGDEDIRMLGTVYYIMPLLGLLGTVLGMLGAFESIGAAGNFTTEAVGKPIWQALLTTAAGLTITIPCHVGYNYLVGRVESMILDMEKAALELTGFFERSRKNDPGK